MLYKQLAELYESILATNKRLEKTEILAQFLKKVNEKDKEVLYLLLGRIYPDYDERKIGISNQLAIKAISKSSGNPESEVVSEWKKIGDLGKVSEKLMKMKKQSSLFSGKHLSVEKVLESLRELPKLEGKGAVSKKISIITELLASASPVESIYLVRTLIGDLRIGIKESTIRDALAKAFFDNGKEISHKIQSAIDKSNDLAFIFESCRKGDLKEIEKMKLDIGKPIKVMLAQKASSLEEGFEKVGKPCAIEYKYDGFRLIIHRKGNDVTLFTRRLENVTKQFPEVVDYVKKYIKGDAFILDSEAVGYDRKTKEYTSFQAVSQRIRRKYDIEHLKEQLPIEINVFDILFYEGDSLLDEPFKKRSEILRKIIRNNPYKIIKAKQIITSDIKKARDFYKQAIKENQEGVMMKNLEAKYQPGSRVGQMLKIKPEEKELDLVITGAEFGKGKRKGWFSSFILSCRGKELREYLEIGKVGTGIKEKSELGVSFSELTEKLKPLVIEEERERVRVKPKIVVAVTYQEIQRSPNYNSGFALRFPRITALRPDKPVSEIADIQEIKRDFEDYKR